MRTKQLELNALPNHTQAPAQRGFRESHSAGNGGFTLIELLVVIAILASLLLPALGRPKLTVSRVACASNLRQQAIALSLYVGDYGAYPPHSEPIQGRWGFWADLLTNYAGGQWPTANWRPPDDSWMTGHHSGTPSKSVFACPGYNRIGGVYLRLSQGLTGAYA